MRRIHNGTFGKSSGFVSLLKFVAQIKLQMFSKLDYIVNVVEYIYVTSVPRTETWWKDQIYRAV